LNYEVHEQSTHVSVLLRTPKFCHLTLVHNVITYIKKLINLPKFVIETLNKINLGHFFCYLVFYKINTFEHDNPNLNEFVISYLGFYKNLGFFMIENIYNIFTNKIIIQI
jgi:hypothetical protein